MDFSNMWNADEIMFYTDASSTIGLGGFCNGSWMMDKWDSDFLKLKPSIEFLELFAVTAGILAWIHRFKNKRIILFCDNMSAVEMINSSSSRCKNCMVLIRIIVLQGLIHNVRVFAKHIKGSSNGLTDSLSRGELRRFRKLAMEQQLETDKYNTEVPEDIWPVWKTWL